MKNSPRRKKNIPVLEAGESRPAGRATRTNLGEASVDATKLAQHLKKTLPDWARRKK